MFKPKHIEYGIVRANPLPSKKELMNFYKNKYYQESDGTKTSYDSSYTEEELQHKCLESKLAVRAIQEAVNIKNIKFVELGCGEGFLLNEAYESGFEISGIDHSEYGVGKWHPHLKQFCQCGDIYDYMKGLKEEGARFDVCAMKNVLEHVIDPAYLLNEIKNILKPGGKILITVPNDYSSLQKKLLNLKLTKEEEWFCPPDHLYYFNTENFVPFVHDLGFEILDMYSAFPVDLFLLHPGSNYVMDTSKGKEAHFARVRMDLLIAEHGLEKALNLYRAMAKCGVGRNFTVILNQLK